MRPCSAASSIEVFEVAGVLAQAWHAMCSCKDMRQLALITITFMLQAHRGKRATSMRVAEKSSLSGVIVGRIQHVKLSPSSTPQSNCENLDL